MLKKEMKELLASYRSSLDQIQAIAMQKINSNKWADQLEYDTWTKVRILSE